MNKPKPILFSAPMIQAILEDRKTQTRRVVKNPEHLEGLMLSGEESAWCPYGPVGGILWVRETWAKNPTPTASIPLYSYRADSPDLWHDYPQYIQWKPSIHMPYAACRLWLEITGVRVERLGDIDSDDAIAEGIRLTGLHWRDYHNKDHPFGFLDTSIITFPGEMRPLNAPVASYRTLWEAINGVASWHENPYVWVVEFKRIEKT